MKTKKQDSVETLISAGKCIEAHEKVKDLIDERSYEIFYKWSVSRTEDEYQLQARAIELEEKYFKDMILKEYAKELTQHKIVETVNVYSDEFSRVFSLGIDNHWQFRIVESIEIDNSKIAVGMCYHLEKVIEIIESKKNDKLILLHEMIHAYEYSLGNECETYKQYVMLALYRKLEPKIPNLQKLIISQVHEASQVHAASHVHSILFMLKSLDLDLRLKKPLRTVYSYGRKDFLDTPKKRKPTSKKRVLMRISKLEQAFEYADVRSEYLNKLLLKVLGIINKSTNVTEMGLEKIIEGPTLSGLEAEVVEDGSIRIDWVKLQKNDDTIAMAIIAHEIAHHSLKHHLSVTLDDKGLKMEKEADDLAKQWGFDIDLFRKVYGAATILKDDKMR